MPGAVPGLIRRVRIVLSCRRVREVILAEQDLAPSCQIDVALDALLGRHGMDGVIATNTTISRDEHSEVGGATD